MTEHDPISFDIIDGRFMAFDYDERSYKCELPEIMSRFPLQSQGILIPFSTVTELYAPYALCFQLNEFSASFPPLCIYIPLLVSEKEALTISLAFLAMKSPQFLFYPSVVDTNFNILSPHHEYKPIQVSEHVYNFITNIAEACGELIYQKVQMIISGNPCYHKSALLSQSIYDATDNTQSGEFQFSQIN